MCNILPSTILNRLNVIDICISSKNGKLYPRTKATLFSDARSDKRLTYWIMIIQKNRISEREFFDMISAFRLSEYLGKTSYKFLFTDYEIIKKITTKYLAYANNLVYTYFNDLEDYLKRRNALNFSQEDVSEFYKSFLLKEFDPMFYIITNRIFGITDKWNAKSLKDEIRYLNNGLVIMHDLYQNKNSEALIESDGFLDKAQEVINNRGK